MQTDVADRVRPIDLMIVGAPKSGTTSLKAYLGQCPGVITHDQREMIFLASEARYERGYEDLFSEYFPDAGSGGIVLAKSVAVMYSASAIERLRRHNPKVQVVVSLRDPVARAYSEYWYARRRGLESAETFRQAVVRELHAEYDAECGLPATAYLHRGRYVEHVRRLQGAFGPGQIHVFLADQIRDDAPAVCHEILSLFPSIDQEIVHDVRGVYNTAAMPRSALVLRLLRVRKPAIMRASVRRLLGNRVTDRLKDRLHRLNEKEFEPPPMASDIRAELSAYFASCNAQLAELLGLDLGAWT